MTRGRRFFTYSFRVDVRDDPRPKVHDRASPATGVGVPQPELGPRPWNAAGNKFSSVREGLINRLD